MHESPIDNTQRMYARLAGFMYLLNYVTAVLGAARPATACLLWRDSYT